MNEPKLLVAEQDGMVVVRVVGRATAKISQPLTAYARSVLKRDISAIVFDLRDCESMDSTFMGVMAMIGLETRGRIPLLVAHANEHHRRLLKSIGVTRLLQFLDADTLNASPGTATVDITGDDSTDQNEMAQTILEAHTALLKIDPENEARFRDVVEILRQELAAAETENDNPEPETK